MTIPESPDNRLLVLLGGGIGGGKSTVLEVFAAEGFALIVADDIGRSILDSDDAARRSVASEWPAVVREGSIDRAALARIVFAEPRQLKTLEAITHPAIGRRIMQEVKDAVGVDVVVEIPLQHLPIGSVKGRATHRLAVVAPPSLRLARAVARGNEEEDVKRRMQRQADEVAWEAWADHVIDNSGAWADTERAVRSLIGELRRRG